MVFSKKDPITFLPTFLLGVPPVWLLYCLAGLPGQAFGKPLYIGFGHHRFPVNQ